MKMNLDVTTASLIKKVNNISDEQLLSWCGYYSKYDYEDQSDCRFNRNDFIDEHYEDILENFSELNKK